MRQVPHKDTTRITPIELAPLVHKLLSSSLQKSSLHTYRRAWKLFEQFYLDVFGNMTMIPVDSTTLALFIAYLFKRSYAPSTVNTYVSAIGYYHRIASQPDPTKTFFIIEMLKGYSKIGSILDSRLPITLPILARIVTTSELVVSSNYEKLLFKAMCSLAFFAFLRIGEITVANGSKTDTNLQVNQIEKIITKEGEINSLKVTFLNHKHNYNQPPFSLIVTRNTTVCPVEAILNYFKVRGTMMGPMFVDGNALPISRSNFSKLLGMCLKACNLDSSKYKGHSFRIGAATHAAQQGFSDARIRLLGRWKSDAFKKYIRLYSVPSV